MEKKITIFGSTGMIGKPVTEELINSGYDVTALVRNTEKARKVLPTGVRFVEGDLEDKRSINESIKNADAIYINISTTEKHTEDGFSPEMAGLDNLLEAAKNNRVKHVLYLSSLLARNYQGDWWVFNAKKTSINRVKKSGVPYTIFYPSNFMENFKNGMQQGNKITTMGKSVNKAWWIAGHDFGKQVARAVLVESCFNNEYVVQGLEPLTMDEAATIYVKNYSKEGLSVSNFPMGVAKFLSIFVRPLKFVISLMEVMNANVETFEAKNTWEELGKPEITLAEFAKN